MMKRHVTDYLYVELVTNDRNEFRAEVVDSADGDGVLVRLADIPGLITALRQAYNDAREEMKA